MKFAIVLAAMAAVTVASGQTLDDCLKQDSISCVQKSLYRKAKDFFREDSYELVRGVSLVRAEGAEGGSRSAKSGKDLAYDQEIESSSSVAERQNVLEKFVGQEITDFASGRSLRINFGPVIDGLGETARALTDSVPQEIRQAADEVVEGRGKKKLLKSILPLLIAAKVKIGALATLAYFGIALLAKKAIIVSLISIAISAFIGLKALWAKSSHGGHEIVTPYNGGWNGGGSIGGGGGGWSSGGSPVGGGWSAGGGSSGWDDSHGAYSSQSQAYSGYGH